MFTTGFDIAVENENMYGVWHVRTDKRVRERESVALYCEPPVSFEYPIPFGQLSPPLAPFQLLVLFLTPPCVSVTSLQRILEICDCGNFRTLRSRSKAVFRIVCLDGGNLTRCVVVVIAQGLQVGALAQRLGLFEKHVGYG